MSIQLALGMVLWFPFHLGRMSVSQMAAICLWAHMPTGKHALSSPSCFWHVAEVWLLGPW